MKKKNIYISIYVLIPFIFAGLSVISATIIYQLLNHPSIIKNLLNISLLIIGIGLFVFILSVIILHLILNPVDKFIKKTQKMPIFQDSPLAKENILTGDITHVEEIFDKVSNILSGFEAKELFPRVIGSSSAMRSIFTQILKVAPTESTIFITGESGTGKELIADSIYEQLKKR
jgi:predicted PurR-regulated permease PerM